jgi:hypothetical protein
MLPVRHAACTLICGLGDFVTEDPLSKSYTRYTFGEDSDMTVNIATTERFIRVLLGAPLLAAPFASGLRLFQSTTATAICVSLGPVVLATSALRSCRIRTCKI